MLRVLREKKLAPPAVVIAISAAIVMGEHAIGWLRTQRMPARLVEVGGRVHRIAGWPDWAESKLNPTIL